MKGTGNGRWRGKAKGFWIWTQERGKRVCDLFEIQAETKAGSLKSWMLNAVCRVRLAITQSRNQENSWRSTWKSNSMMAHQEGIRTLRNMRSSKYSHRKNQKLNDSPIIRKYTLYGGLWIVRGRRAMSPQVHLGMLMVEPFRSWWHHEKQCKWIERLRQWLRTERGRGTDNRKTQSIGWMRNGKMKDRRNESGVPI